MEPSFFQRIFNRIAYHAGKEMASGSDEAPGHPVRVPLTGRDKGRPCCEFALFPRRYLWYGYS